MKARVVSKVLIAAKPSDVFKYLADLQYHYLWNPHLTRINPIGVLEPGLTYRTQSLLFGMKIRGHVKVTKLVAPQELELRSDTGMLRYVVRYRLLAKGSSTQLTCSTMVSSESKAFMFAKPMADLLARRELRSDLEALKIVVEQKLT